MKLESRSWQKYPKTTRPTLMTARIRQAWRETLRQMANRLISFYTSRRLRLMFPLRETPSRNYETLQQF